MIGVVVLFDALFLLVYKLPYVLLLAGLREGSPRHTWLTVRWRGQAARDLSQPP